MMIELVHHHIGQRCEARLAARNRLGQCRRLNDLLAGPAARLGTHGVHDAPLHRQDIEHLIAVLAEWGQRATAIGTGAGAGCRFDPMLLARQMRRQGTDRCGPVTPVDGGLADVGRLGFALQFFQREFQLLDLQAKLLGRLAKGHATKLVKLDAQRRNEAVARRQCRFELGDPGVLVQARRSCVRHGEPLA